jgi:APA family basic amino acid/polyamine antiporter
MPEMPLAAARDGLFPKRFELLNARGMPAFGIVVSTTLASIAMIINYLGSDGQTVFTMLVLMTGITAAIPYLLSAADGRRAGRGHPTGRSGRR